MGRIAIQLVKAAGALVLAAASSHERLRDARAHGADAVVLAEPSTLLERIYALTEGAGCDVVIDGVGGDLFAPSLNALKAHGRYAVSMHACSAWGVSPFPPIPQWAGRIGLPKGTEPTRTSPI